MTPKALTSALLTVTYEIRTLCTDGVQKLHFQLQNVSFFPLEYDFENENPLWIS